MQEAGVGLSADQETQIQGFYDEEAQQRREIMRSGQADPAKMQALTGTTMSKITKTLTPEQKKALLDSMKKPQQ